MAGPKKKTVNPATQPHLAYQGQREGEHDARKVTKKAKTLTTEQQNLKTFKEFCESLKSLSKEALTQKLNELSEITPQAPGSKIPGETLDALFSHEKTKSHIGQGMAWFLSAISMLPGYGFGSFEGAYEQGLKTAIQAALSSALINLVFTAKYMTGTFEALWHKLKETGQQVKNNDWSLHKDGKNALFSAMLIYLFGMNTGIPNAAPFAQGFLTALKSLAEQHPNIAGFLSAFSYFKYPVKGVQAALLFQNLLLWMKEYTDAWGLTGGDGNTTKNWQKLSTLLKDGADGESQLKLLLMLSKASALGLFEKDTRLLERALKNPQSPESRVLENMLKVLTPNQSTFEKIKHYGAYAISVYLASSLMFGTGSATKAYYEANEDPLDKTLLMQYLPGHLLEHDWTGALLIGAQIPLFITALDDAYSVLWRLPIKQSVAAMLEALDVIPGVSIPVTSKRYWNSQNQSLLDLIKANFANAGVLYVLYLTIYMTLQEANSGDSFTTYNIPGQGGRDFMSAMMHTLAPFAFLANASVFEDIQKKVMLPAVNGLFWLGSQCISGAKYTYAKLTCQPPRQSYQVQQNNPSMQTAQNMDDWLSAARNSDGTEPDTFPRPAFSLSAKDVEAYYHFFKDKNFEPTPPFCKDFSAMQAMFSAIQQRVLNKTPGWEVTQLEDVIVTLLNGDSARGSTTTARGDTPSPLLTTNQVPDPPLLHGSENSENRESAMSTSPPANTQADTTAPTEVAQKRYQTTDFEYLAANQGVPVIVWQLDLDPNSLHPTLQNPPVQYRPGQTDFNTPQHPIHLLQNQDGYVARIQFFGPEVTPTTLEPAGKYLESHFSTAPSFSEDGQPFYDAPEPTEYPAPRTFWETINPFSKKKPELASLTEVVTDDLEAAGQAATAEPAHSSTRPFATAVVTDPLLEAAGQAAAAKSTSPFAAAFDSSKPIAVIAESKVNSWVAPPPESPQHAVPQLAPGSTMNDPQRLPAEGTPEGGTSPYRTSTPRDQSAILPTEEYSSSDEEAARAGKPRTPPATPVFESRRGKLVKLTESSEESTA